MIDVSCILINYNTADFTINCVTSILENTHEGISFEIILIDNASSVSDYTKLKSYVESLSPTAHIVLKRSKQNLGFGGGNMLGVQFASPCTYYAFINNDTLLTTPDTLLKLKRFMEQTPDAAVCSPQMLDENENFRVTIDHFSSLGREILRRPLLEKLFPNTYRNRKIRYDEPTKVHYVQGAFMFVNAVDFNTVGGFDTNLFLYYEESDLSLRLLKQVKKHNYLVPEVEYVHFKSASTTKNITIKIEQKLSLIYHTEKHYGYLSKKLLLTYFVIRYFFSSLVNWKYWKLFFILLKGAPLSYSLKQQQSIHEEV